MMCMRLKVFFMHYTSVLGRIRITVFHIQKVIIFNSLIRKFKKLDYWLYCTTLNIFLRLWSNATLFWRDWYDSIQGDALNLRSEIERSCVRPKYGRSLLYHKIYEECLNLITRRQCKGGQILFKYVYGHLKSMPQFRLLSHNVAAIYPFIGETWKRG